MRIISHATQYKAETVDSKENKDQQEIRSTRLRTSLLMLGSALVGGIAVVLWNRRSLSEIQNQAKQKNEDTGPIDEDAIY